MTYGVYEYTGCGKPDCPYCRLTKNNDGRISEEGILYLGLMQREKPQTIVDYLNKEKAAPK